MIALATHDPDAAALVGRERELSALRAALAAALAGRGSLVLIGGEAGIGKTALAEALLAEAQAQGALVLAGRCYDLSETPPYGPWQEALARAPRDADLPPPPDLATATGVASQFALFAAVGGSLAALGTRHPAMLLLDDLHWADQGSLDLLRFVARGLATLPVLLLATYRADELTRRHPLYALLPALVREARAARLDLRPLDEAAIGALVRGRYPLSPADAGRLAAYLAGRAEGNPFFAGELLRALEEGTVVRPTATGWALGDLLAAGVPPLLRQVIDARVDRLGEDARGLLAIAAVAGQEVSLGVWTAAAGGAGEEALLDIAERAADARLVATTGDGIRFAHALIREALYEGIIPLRRRALHRRVAEALLAAPAPDPDAVAYHLRQANDSRAAAWLIRAGERAWRAYAWLTAAAHYEAALALLEAAGGDPAGRARLLLTLAVLRRYADPHQSLALAEEAARLAALAGDATLVAAARFDEGHLRCLTADPAGGLEQMLAALPALEALPPAERRALPAPAIAGLSNEGRYHRGKLVYWLAQVGRFAEARDHYEPLAADTAGEPDAWIGRARVHAAAGEVEEARRLFALARRAYRAIGDHFEIYVTLNQELWWVAVPYRADRVEERRGLAVDAAAALAQAAGITGARTNSGDTAAMQEFMLDGRWALARTVAEQLLSQSIYWGYGGARVHAFAVLGALARAWGEPDRAWACVHGFFSDGSATSPGTKVHHLGIALQRVAAGLALDAGDHATARDWLAAHDRWLAWSGSVLYQAEGQLGWAAYHRAMGDGPAARDHAEHALALAKEPRQPLALLAAHRLCAELDTGAGDHADARAHLDQALALADACAAPYERALTLLALAELRVAAAEHAAAAVALAEAHALLAPLAARPALARAAALAERLAAAPAPPAPALPFGLSAREAEVLRLVAAGLPNAEVAERLSLSRRTVEQHLRAVYDKLGVDNRTAAARLAVERGLA